MPYLYDFIKIFSSLNLSRGHPFLSIPYYSSRIYHCQWYCWSLFWVGPMAIRSQLHNSIPHWSTMVLFKEPDNRTVMLICFVEKRIGVTTTLLQHYCLIYYSSGPVSHNYVIRNTRWQFSKLLQIAPFVSCPS